MTRLMILLKERSDIMCNKSLKEQIKECSYNDNIFDVIFGVGGHFERVRCLRPEDIETQIKRLGGSVRNAQVFQSKVFKSELIIMC